MKRFKLLLITIVSACLLSACGGGGGGGGGGGSVTNTNTDAEPTETIATDNFTEIVIPDPVSFYDYACDNPAVQHVIPIDINNDHQDDFIIHYWCARPSDEWGEPYSEPTPDALVVQLSQPDGTYEVANADVFGADHINLGGASRKYVRGDINHDGRDDFAFAMNYEDGRDGSDWDSVEAVPAVLMSTGDTGYEVVHLGVADWGHSVGITNNVDGTTEVYFTGFTGAGIQAFRYVADTFVDVSNTYPDDAVDWAYGVRSINDENDVTQYIISSATVADPDAETYTVLKRGVALYKRIDDLWTEVSTFYYDANFSVDFVTGNGTEVQNSIFTVNGRNIILYGFDLFHIMKGGLSGYDDDIIVGKLAGSIDESGTFIEGETYYEDNGLAVQTYQFFDISGGELTSVSTPVVDEVTDVNYNFFAAKDINGDDYPDLVTYAFTTPWDSQRVEENGKPIIYLNNQAGQLVNTDISDLHGYVDNASSTSIVDDVDNDGITDLVLFGLCTDNSCGGGIIKIYLFDDFID